MTKRQIVIVNDLDEMVIDGYGNLCAKPPMPGEGDGQVESSELNTQQPTDHQHDWEWEEEKPIND